ncbi:DnaT-like ssDNA-binding domain-containing protein [Neptunomonas japonica]|uniref:DnaT-like ssDNA-binding domain-containing protein n=1 Tax=Neptunomonas japonica TaxID=417574 RepID=UPI00040FA65A|nr:DnaT-like ssDNA-binding domain-containing protein [Neptunomonas japonica]
MSITIPEKPLFIYPSLARQLGVEAALLFYLCHEQLSVAGIADQSGNTSVVLSTQQWRRVTEFWSVEKTDELLAVLSAQTPIQVIKNNTGSVRVTQVSAHGARAVPPVIDVPEQSIQAKVTAPSVVPSVTREYPLDNQSNNQTESPPTSTLPVLDTPPPYPRRPLPSRNTMRDRGPAPAFGGSIGWKKQKDELEQLFDRHEERNQQLHMMHMGWTPSEMFYSILPRHQIPREFVETCLDEFILYYIDKERKESNWDQKFLAWIKREWVQKQTRDAREQRNAQQRNEQQRYTSGSGKNDENTRTDTREKRKRVTAAIMDIKDTDW